MCFTETQKKEYLMCLSDINKVFIWLSCFLSVIQYKLDGLIAQMNVIKIQ